MARDHARIFTSIWADDDFRARTSGAQRLFQLLVTQQEMTYAGVLDLKVRRWASCAPDTTPADIEKALQELDDSRFVVVDYDTEEVLVRSFIRRDEIWKQPKMLALALKQIEPIQSRRIRHALRVELLRLPQDDKRATPARTLALTLPDTPGDTPPDTPARTHSDTPPDTHGDTHAEGYDQPLPIPIAIPPRACGGAPGSQEYVVGASSKSLAFNGERPLLEGEFSNAREEPLPADWAPNDEHDRLAASFGLVLDVEAVQFAGHNRGQRRTAHDWDQQFRAWLAQSKKFGRSRMDRQDQTADDKAEDFLERAARLAAAAEPRPHLRAIAGGAS